MRHTDKQRFGATLDKAQRAPRPRTKPTTAVMTSGAMFYIDDLEWLEARERSLNPGVAKLTESLIAKGEALRERQEIERRHEDHRRVVNATYGSAW